MVMKTTVQKQHDQQTMRDQGRIIEQTEPPPVTKQKKNFDRRPDQEFTLMYFF